jgi:hypothetical protein
MDTLPVVVAAICTVVATVIVVVAVVVAATDVVADVLAVAAQPIPIERAAVARLAIAAALLAVVLADTRAAKAATVDGCFAPIGNSVAARRAGLAVWTAAVNAQLFAILAVVRTSRFLRTPFAFD